MKALEFVGNPCWKRIYFDQSMVITDIEPDAGAPKSSGSALLNWTFSRMFQGLIYNQVWEDPLVDLKVLELGADHRIVMIGSAGCNALAYLAADVRQIDAVDINPSHRALFTLKLVALARLPEWSVFFRFFGTARNPENIAAYDEFLACHLPEPVREHWSGRGTTGSRRIGMFRSGFYRHGLLQRFIGLMHAWARTQGCDPARLVHASSLAEQARLFSTEVAPIFRSKLTRALVRNHLSLFALGIPPAQYDRLAEGSAGDMSSLLIKRIERLACEFPIAENPFAWQVFAREYGAGNSKAIPYYLEPQVYDTIRPRADRVRLHGLPIVEYLKGQPRGAIHRFVLLDAQDWMSRDDVAELWNEIERTAHPEDARVLYRTAGPTNPFNWLPEQLRSKWNDRIDLVPALTAADRTALYSGVHIAHRRQGATILPSGSE